MTLTEFSYYTRRFLPYIIGGFFLFVGIAWLVQLWITMPKKTASTPTTNPLFGKISTLKADHSIAYPPDITFKLETTEGKPITATSSAAVYFIPQKTKAAGAMQKVYLMAKTLGFDTQKIAHETLDDGKKIEFADREKTLTIDPTTFNFLFTKNYKSTPYLFDNALTPTEPKARQAAVDFLRQLGSYPPELAKGGVNVIFLHYNVKTREFDVVTDATTANVVEVDFFRPDIGSYPLVSPKYFNAQNYVVMVRTQNDYEVISARNDFFEKDESTVGVYPLKTGDKAWKDLSQGKGFIVSPGGKSYPIRIQQMFLAYYDPSSYQKYLQPVYVFLGENNFAAYVPAIQDEYVE